MKRQRGLMRKYEDGDKVGSISIGQYQLLQAIELDSASELLCCWLNTNALQLTFPTKPHL